MAKLLIFIGIGFSGIGLNRALAYAKAERRVFQTLIADPAPAAESALWLKLAVGKLPAWKRRSFVALGFLADWTTWPVPEVLEYRERRRRPDYVRPVFKDARWRGSKEELTPEHASRGTRRRSMVTCAASLFLVFTAGAFVTQLTDVFEIKLLTWVLVIGTVARQIQDLLANKFISTAARRSGRPMLHGYRDVVITAAADLLTLSICSVLLLRWLPGQPLRNDWFREQLLAVINGGNVTHLRPALTQSPSAVLVAVASITFYSSLLGPLKSTVGHRRSGDDLVAAAESALRHGRLDRAQHLLKLGRSKEPSPSEKGVSRVEGLINLSEGNVLEAWEAAQALVRLYRRNQNLDELRQREDGLFVVQGWCRELGVTPQPTIVEMARDVPVRDSMMACLLPQNFDALLPDSLPRARAVALEAVLDPSVWPLTFSVVHELDGDMAAARRSLPAADRVTGLDLLWRNQLARWPRATSDRNQLGVAEASPGKIKEDAWALLADIATSDITTWPEWHRSAFSRALSLPLVLGAAAGLDDQLAEALTSTRDAIAGELGEDAEIQVLRNIILGKGRNLSAPDD